MFHINVMFSAHLKLQNITMKMFTLTNGCNSQTLRSHLSIRLMPSMLTMYIRTNVVIDIIRIRRFINVLRNFDENHIQNYYFRNIL